MTFDEATQILRQESRLFSGFTQEMLDDMGDMAVLGSCKAGTRLMIQGEVNYYIYFLLSGSVTVQVNGNPLYQLCRCGDVFGEMSCLNRQPVSADIFAETDVSFLKLDFEMANFQYESVLLFKVMSMILSDKLRLTTAKIECFREFVSQAQRVNVTLSDIAREEGMSLFEYFDSKHKHADCEFYLHIKDLLLAMRKAGDHE
ncbi:MAG: cyclic nucleotide-binding domain-containing protein [SAR324 cluster bacterium]|nr:cyclic nucleotide-binding domain-containing protein [SAR324 cluster bacterium]